ncbi:MAG TPA: caspase family protein, partial [Ferruginibacter sp.]|nr:caspase family protein [Ferruginibacter sp.]
TNLFTVANRGALDVYNANTGKFCYKHFIAGDDDYLVMDSLGRYDGTETARKQLYFTCGTEVIELESVKDQLWTPNLAERILQSDPINSKTLNELNLCGLTPAVENMGNNNNEYRFKITPRRGGLGESVLMVNGIEARRFTPGQLTKNGNSYELLIKKDELETYFIAGKENPVTLKAYTADNAISSRGLKIKIDKTREAVAPVNLYAVMVGVSDYKGDELDLKYAAKDATDISAAISNAAKKLLNATGGEHVFMYNLTTAKDHYQLPEKNSIKKIMEEIGKKSSANDILLIFFAGHGIMEGEKKQFYFLTADASKITATSAIAEVGISTAELTEWMKPQNIKAQKRILIFDACNSGQAIKDFVQMGSQEQNYVAARNDDKAQQIKAIDKLNERSGLFILSASASNQSAYEMSRYAQGLLTYALLKAIRQQPDILEEGKYLDVGRWFSAAEKTVSEIAKENGSRQDPQIVTNTNFNIGIVDEEVIAKINLPKEKPLFSASNFQNSDEAIADDDLELSKQVNLQLNDLSARGIDAAIMYVTATNSPDAYSLSGRYTVTGNGIKVTVNIKQNKTIKTKFEMSGSKDKLSGLAVAIAEKAAGMVK